jgi:hypothetical protein
VYFLHKINGIDNDIFDSIKYRLTATATRCARSSTVSRFRNREILFLTEKQAFA